MIYGLDTDFLVATEIINHPFHQQADTLLQSILNASHHLALAPQIMAEFIHIVTDAKRMPHPLTIAEAISRAEHWWQASEVIRIYPDGNTVEHFLNWLTRYQLGRKRLLDTLFASSLQQAGVKKIITNNERDFKIFGCFEIVSFR